jgi:predicted N-acetyltransferase YhbS
MKFRILDKNSKEQVANLFTNAFASSEGEQEGALIGGLAWKLAARADNQETICLGAVENGSIIAAIFFTRIRFNVPTRIYMLSPVAVSTELQGQGIGQALISHGLIQLKNRSVDVVITYGDPAFYSKVGFQVLSEKVIQAPFKLSMPEGWLGQSLKGKPIQTINGRPTCVEEFRDPAYW